MITGKNFPVSNDFSNSDNEVTVEYDAGIDLADDGVKPDALGNFTAILEVSEKATVPSNNTVSVSFIDDNGTVVLETFTHRIPDALSDRDVLVALYNATDGANWAMNTNWLSNEPLGEWHGVTTNANGRVTLLELPGNDPSGGIPPELGSLSNLEWLDLSGNQLSEGVPSELGSLSSLTHLFLEFNELSGEIPVELGSLSNLEWLWLGFNDLSGGIPSELGNLSNLETLDLGGNTNLSGPLPDSFTGLTSLNSLSLSFTGLCAPTDDAFQDWLDGIADSLGVSNCTADPLFDHYDTNNNDRMDRGEVIAAINDYLFGEPGGITRADVIRLINLYLFG